MKIASFSALALVAALLLYVGSIGPWYRLAFADTDLALRLSKFYLPLTIFRGTPVENGIEWYIALWWPGPRTQSLLDWIHEYNQ